MGVLVRDKGSFFREFQDERDQVAQRSFVHTEPEHLNASCLARVKRVAFSDEIQQKSVSSTSMSQLTHVARLGLIAVAGITGGVIGGIVGLIPIAHKIARANFETNGSKPGLKEFLLACYQCSVLTGLCASWQMAQSICTEDQLMELIDAL